ncbi:MAG: hypothetical protein PHH21_00380 [Candidatus Pacebacteria bacterium]|nr:hypothetical protein [Candidatus Paceibacterota bacterium]
MKKINVAIIGTGNVASSFYQGLAYYAKSKGFVPGLMNTVIGGYPVSSIKVVAAFDIDARKVGRTLDQALQAKPNCTKIFVRKFPKSKVVVRMGPVLDGVGDHMKLFPEDRTFVVSKDEPVDVVAELKRAKVQVVIILLPAGSQKAVEHYAQAALEAGCALVNGMSTFIASEPVWENKFKETGLPCVGDDVKTQIGATIVHRAITRLFAYRRAILDTTYQANFGGNTDFLNMRNPERTKSKLASKYESINSLLPGDGLSRDELYSGPADYLPQCNDSKIAYINWRGKQFGDIPIEIELKMSVEDSPNSACCLVDAVRLVKTAMDRGIGGDITAASQYLMKRPLIQPKSDEDALRDLERFINDTSRNMMVSFARTRKFAQSGEYSSESWTDILESAEKEAERLGIHLETMAPEETYNDPREFISLVRIAVKRLNSFRGYERNLFIPFNITDKELKAELIKVLRKFTGNIYGLNVPPDDDYRRSLKNIRGYIGMDERLLGESLFTELVSKVEVRRIMVVRHEENQYGHDLRAEGIVSLAKEQDIEVFMVKHEDGERMKEIISLGDVGIITFGCRGTEKVLDLNVDAEVPIVTVDTNKRIVRTAIKKSNKVILTSFIQEGLYGGAFFSYDGVPTHIINPTRVTA